jgi:hypothetical protein
MDLGKEKLLDYKNFQINIYCLLPLLDFYLNIDGNEKINPEHDRQSEVNKNIFFFFLDKLFLFQAW